MKTQHSFYRFILLENLLVPVILNYAINWCLAWAIYGRNTAIPLWGARSMANDTLLTSLLLPWISCWINSRILDRQVRLGLIPRLSWETGQWFWRLATQSVLLRGLALGLFCLVGVAFPLLNLLSFSGLKQFELQTFLIVKASYAAFLAALISPIVAVMVVNQKPSLESTLSKI